MTWKTFDTLLTILLKEPYRKELTWRGVSVVGARFVDAIDLSAADLPHRFGLFDSLIEKSANLSGLRSKYPISFAGSKIRDRLDMTDGDVEGVVMANARRSRSHWRPHRWDSWSGRLESNRRTQYEHISARPIHGFVQRRGRRSLMGLKTLLLRMKKVGAEASGYGTSH
jgi:hypothetical protein